MRPRKGRAQEQVDKQRGMLREDQRHGGEREQRQGHSRVRSRYGSITRYNSEEEGDYGYQELGNDRRVKIHYERPARVRDRDALTYEDSHVLPLRQSPPNHCENVVVARSAEGRV